MASFPIQVSGTTAWSLLPEGVTILQMTYSILTGLYTCMDGSHKADWRYCNDDREIPNCNDVEYGTRCDGSENENSWTDEEASDEGVTKCS
jgi:hypothetical protein